MSGYYQFMILAVVVLTGLLGCSGGSNNNNNDSSTPPFVGLHIISAIYDQVDPQNIDDNVLTVYFSETIDPASLPITPLTGTAFTIPGNDEISARSVGYSLIHDFAPALSITLNSISLVPIPGETEIALAAGVITDFDGNPADAANPAAVIQARQTILKTGQVLSYDETGRIIGDNSIKDDGFYQTGIARNFSRDIDSEIVTDHASYLVWQDNQLILDTWRNAQAYCEALNLGGRQDWYLPSIKQLFNGVNFGRDSGIETEYQFLLDTSEHWSSTIEHSVSTGSNIYWYIKYHEGGEPSSAVESANREFHCVRGLDINIVPDYIRHPEHELLLDASTQLIWQDNDEVVAPSWGQALTICENLSLGGFTDWRLANINELYSLVNYENSTRPLGSNSFSHITSGTYWSSTSSAQNPEQAWAVRSFNAQIAKQDKTIPSYYALCVRG